MDFQGVSFEEEALEKSFALSKTDKSEEWLSYELSHMVHGSANAVLNIGNIYYNGIGVLKNSIKAFYYYRIAAFMGYASGLHYIGNAFLKGDAGYQKDVDQALVWYLIGARKNTHYALLWHGSV